MDQKVLYHPGEVNKIREIPGHPHLVVTHTDSPELYVWNTDTQPDRGRAAKEKSAKAEPSKPDLRLVGHKEDAMFPLATSAAAPFIASGGSDKLVLLWSLEDSMSKLLAGTAGGANLPARSTLKGHTATVEDVVFKPSSFEQLASVGDDQMLMLWDTRTGSAPVQTVKDAHGKGHDIQCVDWDGHAGNAGNLIATGAADGSLRIWDVRKLGSNKDAFAVFTGVHTGGIIRLEWHPTERGVFASGGEDKLINVWRVDPDAPQSQQAQASKDAPPPELMFQHAGHRRGKVVDFQWSPDPGLPWSMLSVSDDVSEESNEGGGSLQMWRINHLIYGPEDDVVAELEAQANFVLNGAAAGDSVPTPNNPTAMATD
ncbi:hypothetical protein FOA52_003856 [Chlamydomonas sp. UWO 241]|nr:hypothetical protein FOA52_003856 [Chlamydomonas sp. UWO 241]